MTKIPMTVVNAGGQDEGIFMIEDSFEARNAFAASLDPGWSIHPYEDEDGDIETGPYV
jgi:hypothetical protein